MTPAVAIAVLLAFLVGIIAGILLVAALQRKEEEL